MPQLIPFIVAAIGAGTTIYGLTNQPSAPKVPAAPPAGVTALQNEQKQQAEKASIGQQVPNVLASTSGLANPEYVAQIAKVLAGETGPGSSSAARSAVGAAFGLPPFTPAGSGGGGTGSTSPTSLSDFADTIFYG